MEKPVGELIKQWQSYLANISTNLTELSEQTEYQIIKLKAKDAANGYTGITKAKADECVENVNRLWRYFAILAEVVQKANSLYSKNSFLNNTEKEVRELLETAALVIETERTTINERSLTGSKNSERRATPLELLKYMQESFESVCSTVSEISKAAETVDVRLSSLKSEIARLSSSVKRLGINNIPVFDIGKVAKIENNPLQGSLELDKLVYSVEKYRASIKSVEEEYNNLVKSLNKIRDMLSELKDLAAKSKDIFFKSQCLFGYDQNIMPVIKEEVLISLQDWLQVLEAKFSEGSLSAVKIGVSRLEQECCQKLITEQENYYKISKDYNEWLDLKGQFKALSAKAESLKIRGFSLDRSVNELKEKTQAALYAKTVQLDICRQLVRKYESSLKM